MFRTIFVAMLLLSSGASEGEEKSPGDNPELKKLFDEDQADRMPPAGKLIANVDWAVVSARDEVRELRIKELIQADALGTGADYYHAAMILQHASTPNDYLLAHDLCVVAIGKGVDGAKWLAAASLDRFLTSIDRAQRFGTQFQSKRATQRPRLLAVDPSVPDSLRRAFNVPTLDEARKNEAQMARQFEEALRIPMKP